MKTAKLDHFVKIERELVDPSTLDPSTPYLGLEHIERGGRINSMSTVGSSGIRSTKFRFKSDHILFGKLRPNLAKIADPLTAGICSTDILPIRVRDGVDRSFIKHFLRWGPTVAEAVRLASGANLPRVSPKSLQALSIPLLPLEDQRRIAGILDRVDERRSRRHAQLLTLENLERGTFAAHIDALRGVRTTPLGEWASLTAGKSVVAADSFSPSRWRVLKISAVTSGLFRRDESKPLPLGYEPPLTHRLMPGDLLMSRANTSELVGASAIASGDVSGLALPDKIWKFVWRRTAEPRFWKAYLSQSHVRAQISAMSSGSGGSMKNIPKAKLLALPIPEVPIAAQREFTAVVEKIEAQRTRVERALALDDELFASLQYRAFRGEL